MLYANISTNVTSMHLLTGIATPLALGERLQAAWSVNDRRQNAAPNFTTMYHLLAD